MARTHSMAPAAGTGTLVSRETLTPAEQAYRILQAGFVVLPIVAGADKFFHLLAEWHLYIAPPFAEWLGTGHAFMYLVGVIEIAAGIGVAIWPRVFSWVVGVWLCMIAVNLVIGGWYDIALRDVGLAVGAFALARLARSA
jgi:hypothetical protein